MQPLIQPLFYKIVPGQREEHQGEACRGCLRLQAKSLKLFRCRLELSLNCGLK